MSFRRDLLKSYLLTLLAEGQFKSATYSEMLARATSAFSEDLGAVLTEIATIAARQGVSRMGDAVIGAMGRAVEHAKRVGFSGIWDELQAIYKRGATVKAKRR